MPANLTTMKFNLLVAPMPRSQGKRLSVTSGDMHGNVIKLVHFLLTEGIIGFKETADPNQNYKKLVDLYTDTFNFFYRQTGQPITEEAQYKDDMLSFERYEPFAGIEPNMNCWEIKDTDYSGMKMALYDLIYTVQCCTNDINSPNTSAADKVEYQKAKIKFEGMLAILKEKITAFETNEAYQREYQALEKRFDEFLSTIEVKDPTTLCRNIGDLFADRGVSDHWSMKLLQFIQENGVKVTTLASNHDQEFIRYYETKDQFIPNISYSQVASLYPLQYAIQSNILPQATFDTFRDQFYKPTLKLIDYTFTDTGIRIFTHAPINFLAIKTVAEYFQTPYRDDNPMELADTIDRINAAFQAQFVQPNQMHTIANIKAINDFLWNRFETPETSNSEQNRPSQKNNYTIDYVHGHDSFVCTLDYVSNLDSVFGKPYIVPSAEETVLIQNETLENGTIVSCGDYKVLSLHEIQQPLPLPAREGLRSGIIAGGTTAIVLGGAVAALIGLSVIAPPIGVGLIAVISVCVGIALAAGALFGWIAKNNQAQQNDIRKVQIHMDAYNADRIVRPNPLAQLRANRDLDTALPAAAPEQQDQAPQEEQQEEQQVQAQQAAQQEELDALAIDQTPKRDDDNDRIEPPSTGP